MKQVIVVRNDIKMSKGKTAAQVAHAAVNSVLQTNTDIVNIWIDEGHRKIVCKVDTIQEIYKLDNDALINGVSSFIVEDWGLTEFDGVETITCVAIGPDEDAKIDTITRGLRLL